MSGPRQPFDYVVVQLVPRIDRDERLNVGVILYCPVAAFLGCQFAGDDDRGRLPTALRTTLSAREPELDIAAVERQIDAIRSICAGAIDAGPIARLTASERFHWLSAARSTAVQPSPAHTGLAMDPAVALRNLFEAAVRDRR